MNLLNFMEAQIDANVVNFGKSTSFSQNFKKVHCLL